MRVLVFCTYLERSLCGRLCATSVLNFDDFASTLPLGEVDKMTGVRSGNVSTHRNIVPLDARFGSNS